MGTRATIKFVDDSGDEFFVYRGHDGFPENILPDIQDVIDKARGRWSGSELGLLLSMFLGEMYDEKQRIQDYMLTHSFHGDESYRYFVRFSLENGWSVDEEVE